MAEYLDRTTVIANVLSQMKASPSIYAMRERIMNLEVADVVERKLYELALSDVIRLSVERKVGKWKDVKVTDISDMANVPFASVASMRCSECNRYHNEVYHYGNPVENVSFCPNCGANMRGDDNV